MVKYKSVSLDVLTVSEFNIKRGSCHACCLKPSLGLNQTLKQESVQNSQVSHTIPLYLLSVQLKLCNDAMYMNKFDETCKYFMFVSKRLFVFVIYSLSFHYIYNLSNTENGAILTKSERKTFLQNLLECIMLYRIFPSPVHDAYAGPGRHKTRREYGNQLNYTKQPTGAVVLFTHFTVMRANCRPKLRMLPEFKQKRMEHFLFVE